jgi:hypothetical protein
MKRISLLLVCAIVFAIGIWQPATLWADNAEHVRASRGRVAEPQKGREKRGKDVKRGDARAVRRVDDRNAWMDRDHCRIVVNQYYDRRGLPPGLAKKGALPPGLRKQLRERGHLPPGLEKHAVALPVELERRLPPLPPHYVRRCIGDDLLVIDVRANLVVSIMAGVFIRR